MNELIESLKDNDIVVTEYNYKKELLEKLNEKEGFLNIKFINKKEFLSKFYFNYDINAVYYLMDKYGLEEDIAITYLDNLIYIDNTIYNNEKLDKLAKIKKDLINRDLLIFDSLFLEYIKGKTIYFYKYNFFNKLEKNMINILKRNSKVVIIDKKYNHFIPKVYSFNTIFDEVSFVANSISKLIEDGISLNKIKLTNLDSDYNDVIDFIFPLYNLKADINNGNLISNPIAKEFLLRNVSIKEEIELLKGKYNNSEALNKIVKIVNKYIIFDNDKIVNKMIANEFKKTKINALEYENSIKVIDYKNYPINDEYVFMLGFNQGIIPKQYKDEDYITDNLKENLLLDYTVDKNKREKQVTIDNILNIKNLIITYKESTPFGKFFPSNLISDLSLEVIQNKKTDAIYSPDYSKLLLGDLLDKFVLYGTITDDLKKYNSSLDIPYNKYDNSFKGIDNNEFLESVTDGFNLSYSSMNDYYKCAFKYYLSNVLKLNIFEDNFAAYIGSLFHYVLEKGLLSDIDVSSLVEDFINKESRVLTSKERFFVNNIISDIDFALATVKDNLKNTDLKNILFEKKVEVIKNDKVTVTFKGFMDKVMYDKSDNHTIVAIIDYKTGYTDTLLKYVPFGLSMQLPVYLYLASNMKEFDNMKIGGFYLQRVLHGKPVISIKKDIESLKKENLLLYGYSNSDKDILKKVDHTYVESTQIKSMKLKKDGEFASSANVLSDEEINNLIKMTDKKIDEAVAMICDAKFDINPKVDGEKNLGCLYCKYKDICFMSKKDEVKITPDEDLSFLGGDLND